MVGYLRPALLGLIIAVGALPASAAMKEGDVLFTGRLSESAVSSLIEKLSASPHSRLIISSFGGEELAGVRLGEYVQRNRIPIVIREACLSACANSVLIASPEVEFESGAVVAFHHSATSIIQSYSRMNEVPPDDLAEAARAQQDLYHGQGIDIALLACAAQKVGQMDHYVERPGPGSGEARRHFGMALRWWVPQQSTLERLGVAIRRGQVNGDRERVIRTLDTPARQIAFGTRADCR